MEPFHLKHVHKRHARRDFSSLSYPGLPRENRLFMNSAVFLSILLAADCGGKKLDPRASIIAA
jgi:hypothetical protein